MSSLLLFFILPFLTGVLGFVISRLRNEINFLGGLLTLYYSFRLFLFPKDRILESFLGSFFGVPFRLSLSGFNSIFLFAISFFGFLVILYSLRSSRRMEEKRLRFYFFYLFLAIGAANGVLLSSNLILLFFFWLILSFATYGFFSIGRENNSHIPRRSRALIGLSDFFLFGGVLLLVVKTKSGEVVLASLLPLTNFYSLLAFLLITIGIFTKIGVVPFHFWLPVAAKILPTPVMAFISATINRLLGIYLLIRVSFHIFDITSSGVMKNYLMVIGAITILTGVIMAIREKELMSLFSFQGISEVGYVFLGIGSGIPIGLAGAVFHSLNTTLCFAGLFFAVGSIEFWTKETRVNNLGGLVKMPITFFSFLVSGLTIINFPFLSAFFSKWLIYQGVLAAGSVFSLFYLGLAVIGSIFTSFLFLKLTHSLFFGEKPKGFEKIREVGISMLLPGLIIAFLCLVFGVFAHSFPLRSIIYPNLPKGFSVITYQPVLAAILIIGALAMGTLLYFLSGRRH